MRKQHFLKASKKPLLSIFLIFSCLLAWPSQARASAAVSVACQTQVNIALAPDGTAMITPESVADISGDPAELDFITVSPNTFDCNDIGPGTVTVSWSIGGVADQCVVNILIEDKQPPIIACSSDVNISLDADGVVELVGGFFLEFIADNCNTTTTVSPASVSCADIGTPIVATITVTDDGGNSATCFSNVVVEDKTPVVAVCQSEVNISLDFDGTVELEAEFLTEGLDDNCPLTTTVSPASVSCADLGTPVVATVTVTDVNGATNSCFSTITVEDKIGPTAICEANVIVDLAGASSVTLTVPDIDEGSFDNCGIASMSLSQSVFTIADLGSNTVLLTVVDGSGNSNQCFSTVEVINSVYCDSRGTNTNKEYIQKIKFAGINAKTKDNGGYLDNTGEVGNVIPGDTYKITLKPKFPANKKKEFWRVWIDWNQNQLFESSELMLATSSKEKIVAFITIPLSAMTGLTRMRISMKRDAYAEACEVFTRGEVEDYSVNVLPPSSPMMANPQQNGTFAPASSSTLSQLEIYPNPARDFLQISLQPIEGQTIIQLYNLLGTRLSSVSLESLGDQKKLDVSGLQPGTYLLMVEQGDQRKVLPFVKL